MKLYDELRELLNKFIEEQNTNIQPLSNHDKVDFSFSAFYQFCKDKGKADLFTEWKNETLTNAGNLGRLPLEILRNELIPYFNRLDISRLRKTCRFFHHFFSPSISENKSLLKIPYPPQDYSQLFRKNPFTFMDQNEKCCVYFIVHPNGRHIVSSSYIDRSIKIYDLATNKCIQTFTGHTEAVTAIYVLSSGHIVSGSEDNALKIWDPATGKCTQTLTGHTKRVTAISILPNGQIVSGSRDNALKIWDPATGKCTQTLTGHTEAVTAIYVLPCGQIVSGSEDCTLRIWDPATSKCTQTLTGIWDIAVLPNGHIVTASFDNTNTLKIWDPATGKCTQTLTGHTKRVTAISVLPSGQIVSGSEDESLKIWNVITGKCIQTLTGHSHSIRTIAVLPSGQIVSGSYDKSLKIWDPATGKCIQTLIGHTQEIYTIVALTTGDLVSFASISARECLVWQFKWQQPQQSVMPIEPQSDQDGPKTFTLTF